MAASAVLRRTHAAQRRPEPSRVFLRAMHKLVADTSCYHFTPFQQARLLQHRTQESDNRACLRGIEAPSFSANSEVWGIRGALAVDWGGTGVLG